MGELPDLRPGTLWSDTTADQWRNLVETVRSVSNITVGPGLRIDKRADGFRISLDDSAPQPMLGPRFVALTREPQDGDRLVAVRGVRRATRSVEPNAYEWTTPEFYASPDAGLTAKDYASLYAGPPRPPDEPVPDWLPVDTTPFLTVRWERDGWVLDYPIPSAGKLGVVVDIYDGQSPVVLTRAVVPVADEVGRYEFGAADPQDVRVWPGFKSRHYEGFVWTAEALAPETQILPVVSIGLVWYVLPLYRIPSRRLPDGLRFTDCALPTESRP